MRMIERIVTKDEAEGGDLGPRDARAVLRAWLEAVELDTDERVLLGHLQADGFSHAALERRARRCHERKLAAAVAQVSETADWNAIAAGVFEACVAAVPVRARHRVPGARAAAREPTAASASRPASRWSPTASAPSTASPARSQQIRERGVPGFEVEVIGTDANVDRRLSAVAEAPIPYYPGLTVGVPSLLAVVDALAGGAYDLLHVCSPGPAGVAALLTARALGLPVAGSYHTELAAYTALRSGDALLEAGMRAALATFYGQCDVVLSPSGAADTRLHELGIDSARVGRWDRGVDLERFKPANRRASNGDRIDVLYAGRLTREKGVDLLADSFLAARARDPRLHLVLAGGGPEEDALRARLGALRELPRLAVGRRPGRRLRLGGHLPVLLADGHLRPGDPRGAGVGAARRRGRRRRAGRAGGRRTQRRALPGATPTTSRAPSCRWPDRAPPASGSRAAGSRRSPGGRGRPASPASPPAGTARLRSARSTLPWSPHPRRDRSGPCARKSSPSPPRSSWRRSSSSTRSPGTTPSSSRATCSGR